MAKTITYAQWALESYCIGLKLRTLRTQKRLTLARLAAETGLSTALLSKLETDRMIPTLPTLATISRVYGVGMSHFFSEPARHTLSITRKAHLQSKGRGLESMKVTLLSPAADASRPANLLKDAGNPTPAGSNHPLSPEAFSKSVLVRERNCTPGGAVGGVSGCRGRRRNEWLSRCEWDDLCA